MDSYILGRSHDEAEDTFRKNQTSSIVVVTCVIAWDVRPGTVTKVPPSAKVEQSNDLPK